MLTLLLGTDWITTRAEILNKVAEDVKRREPGRVLMVPELISHEMERRLCAIAGDTSSRYAEVLSFTRLARRVSDSVGHASLDCLDAGGRVVAMAAAARQLHSKLKAYASVETKPEFLSGLVEAVDEFKRCCISAADLMAASRQAEGSLAQKLEELSMLLECYDALCLRGKRDPRDQMTWLLEELEDSDFAAEHVFYIDGFPDFTRQHMAILEHLIRYAPSVTVSLNCDCPGSALLAFEKAGQTASELVRCAKALGIEVEIRMIPTRSDVLQPVRSKLFQGRIDATVAESVLQVCRAETEYQECVAAADRVMELVQNGSRYRQIGIVCADMSYRNTIGMLFERCGIPAYISGTEPILEKSVITTVLSAVDIALGGFEQQDVLHYLKSTLSPLDLDTCDSLENYVLMWAVSGKQWLTDWTDHPDGLGEKVTDNTVEKLSSLNAARHLAISPLAHLRDGLLHAAKLSDMVRALYAFLDEIDLRNRLDALARQMDRDGDNRNAQIMNQLWEILLSAMEQMYDVLGETTWDAETFSRLFKLLLSQYDVGTIPPVLDAVTVGPVSSMRCQKVNHLIVLGAQEGNLPGYGGSKGILSDQDRIALREMGVPLTGGAMEGLQAEFAEIYGVFCGAQESVFVSCPAGQPSFVFKRLADLAGGERKINTCLGAAMSDPFETGAFLARMHSGSQAKTLDVFEEFAQISDHCGYQLGRVTPENIQKLYGKTLHLSASQIDKQEQCRLSYFLQYGLRAKERKEMTIDPAEFGTYVHAVLENTAREVMERGGFKKTTLDEIQEIANRYSEEYASERFRGISTQRVLYLFHRNVRELSMIVEELWIEMQNSEFEPVGFEVAFGDDEGHLAPIPINGQNMQGVLRGYVDRVDAWKVCDRTFFRVVDYKTGKKSFDYCDVFNGLGLQMLLYLFALEQAGDSLLGSDPIPAGVQYFPARVPVMLAERMLTDEEARADRMADWKRKGLLLSDEAVLNAMATEETRNRLPCTWRKDGSISGDLADSGQLRLLRKYVFRLLENMVDEIASGCVEANPYTRGTSFDACRYCPYKTVCRPETVANRRDYQAMPATRFWEEIMKEEMSNG